MSYESFPSAGAVTYNGFRLPGPVKLSISSYEPVTNEVGVVLHHRVTVSAEFILHDGAQGVASSQPIPITADANANHFTIGSALDNNTMTFSAAVTNAVKQLTTPRQELILNSCGLLDGTFNNSTDREYGPIPRIVSINRYSNLAARITWSCTFTVGLCDSGQYDLSAIYNLLSHVFDITWSINEQGASTRTINGTLTFNNRLKDDANIAASVNRPIEAVNPDEIRKTLYTRIPRLPKFLRTQNYKVTRDRKSLEYSIVDTEIASPNPYFPYMVKANIKQRLRSSIKMGFRSWVCDITGSFTLAQGVPNWVSLYAFFEVVRKRREAIKGMTYNAASDSPALPSKSASGSVISGSSTDTTTKEVPVQIFTQDIMIENSLTSHETSFMISWILLCDLKSLFQASGIWAPTDGSWDNHHMSLEGHQNERGTAQLRDNRKKRTMPQPCGSPGWLEEQFNNYSHITQQYSTSDLLFPEYEPETVEPDSSWILFEHDVTVLADNRTAFHMRLGGETAKPFSAGTPAWFTNPGDRSLSATGGSSLSAPIATSQGGASYTVIFSGRAIRVGYPVPNLGLATFNKLRVEPTTTPELFRQTCLRNNPEKVPIYVAAWSKEYKILGTPTGSWTSDAEIVKVN